MVEALDDAVVFGAQWRSLARWGGWVAVDLIGRVGVASANFREPLHMVPFGRLHQVNKT